MTEAARLLRYARRRAGLTQRDLAAKCGVAQSYVARVESGRIDPSVSSLSRLLRACETTLEAMPGSGEGVDRTLFTLDRTPAERMAQAAPMAQYLDRVERRRAAG
jgi:transcriptional regulator with XRE-family HTH domain